MLAMGQHRYVIHFEIGKWMNFVDKRNIVTFQTGFPKHTTSNDKVSTVLLIDTNETSIISVFPHFYETSKSRYFAILFLLCCWYVTVWWSNERCGIP